MTLRHSILALLLLAPALLPAQETAAQDNDEVGVWTELGLEKAITKKWDVGVDLEYRAQNRARFSAGLSTSYKPFKFLKLGVGYNFLYSFRPDKYKNKDEGEEFSDEWIKGYNHTPEYWFPRHRFSAEATGSIKFWGWFKVSLRERYQLTHSRARSVDKLKHREINEKKYDFDEDWNEITWYEKTVTDEVETTEKPSFTDQVLRSRIKFEFDKKRNPFSPFVSAEFHNSVSRGDHMLLQKIRASIGSSYKFRKHNEVSLAYIITFDMYDVEENEVVRLHDRLHAINIGYKYSF
ncbi:MAG: DUF2490 domain-containing protein [Bacteroidaceae bacterium]|nr:DUF2490 domain-containing protein [Bacteroidaceae bacterium]MBR4516750.1 DUF2490 domain-containing protein [Bacteroidaceae bacterium]